LGAVPDSVPFVGPVSTVKVWPAVPSGSVLPRVIATGTARVVTTAASVATGASFTGVTVIDTVPLAT
jgi:hypothetical protein